MSEPSSGERGGSYGWPPVMRLSVSGVEPLRHALMLERCFDGRDMRWSDATIARTRRHAGGCATAIETALRMEMATQMPAAASLIESLPHGHCWTRIQTDPALLEAALLGHFRDRAAIGLMQRDPFLDLIENGEGNETATDEESVARPFDPSLDDLLASLQIAQAGWADGGPDDRPMRLDLPAEMMAELVWTVAAILAEALAHSEGLPDHAILMLADQCGGALIARHDEQTGPLALAALFAHRARAASMTEEQLLHLARNRHVLALLAVLADRTAVDLATLIRASVECSEHTLFGLCRAADFPREVAVRLVLGRRCVARGMDDSMLVEYADDYEGMPRSLAATAVAGLGIAEPLRAKLTRSPRPPAS